MQKFVNIWFSLPRSSERYDDYGEKYLNFALKSMLDVGEEIKNTDLIELLRELVKAKKPSYREIEQILSNVALVHNMSFGETKYYPNYQTAIAFMCYLKASFPKTFDKVSKKNITFNELIKESGFEWTETDSKGEYGYIHYMIKEIKFEYADENTRKRMIADKEIKKSMHSYSETSMLVQITNMLSAMETR